MKKLIIILGFTLNPDCSIAPILKLRLDEALRLYQPTTKIVVTGKTPPKLFVPNRCEQLTEAEAMANYLIKHGVPADDIFKEEQSTTTLTNAFYTYWNYLRHQTGHFESINIISNEFHYPLVKYCFDLIFGEKYSYSFVAIKDSDIDVSQQELNQWKMLIAQLTTQCYPKIFESIKTGDVMAVKNIIDNPSLRKDFDVCIKQLLNLDATATLDEFI